MSLPARQHVASDVSPLPLRNDDDDDDDDDVHVVLFFIWSLNPGIDRYQHATIDFIIYFLLIYLWFYL